MILPLILIFGVGAAAAVALARESERNFLWVAGFLEVLLAFHELSFAIRATAEWIRIDLLLTLPLFTAGNFLLTVYGIWRNPGWWVFALGASALAVPIWFFWFR